MSKINQFNSNFSEAVESNVRPQGSQGAGSSGLLPSQLQTAQSNAGIDTPEGITAASLSEAMNPHGALVRNPNIASLDPSTTDLGLFDSLDLSEQSKQVRVGLDNFGTSNEGFSQVTVTAITRDNISMPSNQSLIADTVIPNVGSRFFR